MRLHWLWYQNLPGMSPEEKIALLQHFESPEDIYKAQEFPSVAPEAQQSLMNKDLTWAEQILGLCARKNIHILTWQDPKFPQALRNIPSAPLVLYYKGILPDFGETAAIGVVGTRKATSYGLTTAKRLGFQLARCGGMVITGMAKGVDTQAAVGALLGGGTVVGVLGCGVDVVYPTENRELFSKVCKNGCLISEYPPETPPVAWHFPQRNRIISGMSHGVLVVEAPEKSGALITARFALEQGREVYATPGNLGVPGCAGSNALLREGAALVTCGWDILSDYQDRYAGVHFDDAIEPEEQPLTVAQNTLYPTAGENNFEASAQNFVDKASLSPYSGVDTAQLSQEEQQVLALLTAEGQPIDDIIAASGLSDGAVLAALTTLEILGLSRTLSGNRVARQ